MRYAYQAVDRGGKTARGKAMADSAEAAIQTLREQGLYVTKLSQPKGLSTLLSPSSDSWLSMDIHIGRKVKSEEFAIFTRQIATLMRAGVTIADGVRVLGQQTENKAFARGLQQVAGDLRQGSQFSEAVAKRPAIFPAIFINMARAGEMSGNLDEVLDKLAIFFEKEHYNKQKIKSAMTYPMTVGVLAIGVVFFLMTNVIPTFVNLFAGFHAQLPLPTRIVMATSRFFVQFWYVVIGLIVGVVIGYQFAMRKEPGRFMRDTVFMRLPVFGELMRKSAMARMARTLSSLFAGSVPVLQSLELTSNAVENAVVSRALMACSDSLTNGQPLSEPLANQWVFPPLVVHMIRVGEQTGNLDFMLTKIADFYEAETESMVDRLKSLIEPLMIVFLTGIVGTIVLSVIMPMFSLYQQFGNLQ